MGGQYIVTLYQNPLHGERCLGRGEPGHLHAAPENQGERARVGYARALFKFRRLQNFYVQQISRTDGNAFGCARNTLRTRTGSITILLLASCPMPAGSHISCCRSSRNNRSTLRNGGRKS